ncbi:hybrid sensor histidine kinase/response regulator [Spirosoma radiotolerans]|uniref:Chemotaxis protein CheY n=1 Tax=Spirosoma radiotolerans TaxID=1379870 RepID=A0A0E4A0M7_9BACT|nr:response regulator [Spirosoma radiotolerans]AKD58224.1 hypothetical protein SD10_28340 [Spirosoma radiotolerans]
MKPHLLVIEDEEPIRQNVAELLTLNNFSVQTAPNGREGITLAMQQHPDLILCDVMMPGLDGFQTLEVIRSNPILSSVPFLFLTAKTEAIDNRKGMALGADDYLTKPFKIDTLLSAIWARLQRETHRKAHIQTLIQEQLWTITGVSTHEYNTSLTGILGFTSLLMDYYGEFSRTENLSMLNMIKINCLRLKRSLDNNRLMTRLQNISPSDTAYAIFSTGHSVINAAMIEERLGSISYRQDRTVPHQIEVESAQVGIAKDNLISIIDELLDNACKFSTGSQPVHITGRQDDCQYSLTIKNDGQPFNTADMKQIEAYRQFEQSQYEQQGFGLGLAIVKKLLALNNGTLLIDSLSRSETQLRVYLPLM